MSLFALIGFTDSGAWPATNGFHPAFCESWAAWMKLIAFDEVAGEVDGHGIMHGIHGWATKQKPNGEWDNVDRVIGYGMHKEPVTSSAWHARDLEVSETAKAHPHILGDFEEWMQPRGRMLRHLMGHCGAPSVDQAGTPMAKDAYREQKNSGVIPMLDAQNAVASGGCAQDGLTGLTIWGTEPGGTPPGGKVEPQVPGASYRYTTEGLWTKHYGDHTTADQIQPPYDPDPGVRAATCAWWIGKGFCPVTMVKPISNAGWGESENMSKAQVAWLMRKTG